jgi:hypothetical protein
VSGEVNKLEKVSYESRRKLYEMTKMECFRCEASVSDSAKTYSPPEGFIREESDIISGQLRKVAESYKRAINEVSNDLCQIFGLEGLLKLKAGLMKTQRYHPDARERSDAIIELIETLGNEVDYFRTAREDERQILNKKLRENSDSLGYATQMLNVIYSGKGIDSWMLMSQPPARVRKMMKNPDAGGRK